MNPPSTLLYPAMRLAWCRAALRGLIRRWAIYLVVGTLVLGGAGSSALMAMSALAAWSVLPLLQAATHSHGMAMAFTLLYGVVGGILVWGLAPLLWPRAWAEAERALPINPQDRRRSDLTVTLLGLTPLFAVYLAGIVIWLLQSPPWLQAHWGLALLMLLASMLLSAALGLTALWWRRRLPLVPRMTRVGLAPGRQGLLFATGRGPLSVTRALVLLPLWRGPARRSGRFFWLTLAALLGCSASLAVWPQYASWQLAAFAALAQALSTRFNVLVNAELAPLHAAAVALPINGRWLARARLAVVLTPLLVALACLLPTVLQFAGALRPSVLAAYLIAVWLSNLTLVIAAHASQPGQAEPDPSARVIWWLMPLVVSVALASEVFI